MAVCLPAQYLNYRLSVFRVGIPTMRERPLDVAPLARHFVRRAAGLCLPEGSPIPEITAEAMTALRRFAWPGNVRELENAAQRALILARGTDLLPHHFFLSGLSAAAVSTYQMPAESYEEAKQGLLEGSHRQFIQGILERTGGNRLSAAKNES